MMLIDCSSVYALIVVNDKNYIQYLTRENYGVFYHDWRNYGGISPKLPIFSVIILPVTSVPQNFS